MSVKEKTTAPVSSVSADEEQSFNVTVDSIADDTAENKGFHEYFKEMQREMIREMDPSYLPVLSMNELYETAYDSKPPLIDGLLYPGTYLFAGAPKIGKSFFVAQLAYHISKGLPLWGYPVRKGTVLYLALEDDYRRLQLHLPQTPAPLHALSHGGVVA